MGDEKQHMSVVICGHVDSGKSTTTGRLLFELGGIPEREMEKLKEKVNAHPPTLRQYRPGNRGGVIVQSSRFARTSPPAHSRNASRAMCGCSAGGSTALGHRALRGRRWDPPRGRRHRPPALLDCRFRPIRASLARRTQVEPLTLSVSLFRPRSLARAPSHSPSTWTPRRMSVSVV